ncbi:MAG: NADH-quinone oxidoreductase subunit J, partial [Cyclobacteriaceae bacterium]|nr:NADH-quinone oxidoreductase subunit J [Cyclobacteriaceae bacterium]
MEKIIFYILALAIVLFSVMTVTSRNILRAAIYLLFVLMATAGLYFMLNYNFLAAVQLTVYSGGVVVLIVFAVLLTARMDHKLEAVG